MLVSLLLTLAAGRVVDTEASEAPRDLLAFLPLLAPQAAHGFQVSAARQAAPRLATGLAPWTSARAPQLLAAESWEGPPMRAGASADEAEIRQLEDEIEQAGASVLPPGPAGFEAAAQQLAGLKPSALHRAGRAVAAGWRRWNNATVPVRTLRAAYLRALAVCATVTGAQTVSSAALIENEMPSRLCQLIAKWEGVRAAKQIATATGCGFAIFAATDVLAQTLETQQACDRNDSCALGVSLSPSRAVRSGIACAFLGGFIGVIYHRCIARLPLQAKVAVDIADGFINLHVYFAIQALLRGEPQKILSDLRAKVPGSWLINLQYWTLANLITYTFVPLRLRPLVGSLFGIPFSMWMSTLANRKAAAAELAVLEQERAVLEGGAVPGALSGPEESDN